MNKIEAMFFLLIFKSMLDEIITNENMPEFLRYMTWCILYGSEKEKRDLEISLKRLRNDGPDPAD